LFDGSTFYPLTKQHEIDAVNSLYLQICIISRDNQSGPQPADFGEVQMM